MWINAFLKVRGAKSGFGNKVSISIFVGYLMQLNKEIDLTFNSKRKAQFLLKIQWSIRLAFFSFFFSFFYFHLFIYFFVNEQILEDLLTILFEIKLKKWNKKKNSKNKNKLQENPVAPLIFAHRNSAHK